MTDCEHKNVYILELIDTTIATYCQFECVKCGGVFTAKIDRDIYNQLLEEEFTRVVGVDGNVCEDHECVVCGALVDELDKNGYCEECAEKFAETDAWHSNDVLGVN